MSLLTDLCLAAAFTAPAPGRHQIPRRTYQSSRSGTPASGPKRCLRPLAPAACKNAPSGVDAGQKLYGHTPMAEAARGTQAGSNLAAAPGASPTPGKCPPVRAGGAGGAGGAKGGVLSSRAVRFFRRPRMAVATLSGSSSVAGVGPSGWLGSFGFALGIIAGMATAAAPRNACGAVSALRRSPHPRFLMGAFMRSLMIPVPPPSSSGQIGWFSIPAIRTCAFPPIA